MWENLENEDTAFSNQVIGAVDDVFRDKCLVDILNHILDDGSTNEASNEQEEADSEAGNVAGKSGTDGPVSSGSCLGLWLQDTRREAITRKEQITHVLFDRPMKRGGDKTVSMFFKLIREGLLTHRWQDTLTILIALVNEAIGTSSTIFRVGLELFYHDHTNSENLLQHLLSQIKTIGLDPREIMLEYIFYLLQHEHPADDVLDHFKNLPWVKISTDPQVMERAQYCSILFKAYEGLVHYLDWLTLRGKLSEFEGTELSSHSSSELIVNTVRKMQKRSEKAQDCFSALKDEKGVWDVFVKAHLQLLEYYDEDGEAENLLRNYSTQNPDNPVAVKLLVQFLTESSDNGQHTSEITELRQKLYHMIPSDGENFLLYRMLIDQGAPATQTLPIVFDLLDYDCWKQNMQAWKLLEQHLQIASSRSDDDVEALRDCWSLRRDWWPSFHFTHKLNLADSVLPYKAVVAAALIGIDNPCTQFVLSQGYHSSEWTDKITSVKDLHKKLLDKAMSDNT